MADHDHDLARCKHVIQLQMTEIDTLRRHVAALQEAIDKEIGGAHAELIRQYTNPRLSDAARRAAATAAIAYEKAKPGMQVEHRISLFDALEQRRLAKKAETAKMITVTAVDPPSMA
jgi:hypothetical protein